MIVATKEGEKKVRKDRKKRKTNKNQRYKDDSSNSLDQCRINLEANKVNAFGPAKNSGQFFLEYSSTVHYLLNYDVKIVIKALKGRIRSSRLKGWNGIKRRD